jgi:pre-mRNA-splicing factor ISY1
MFHEASLNSLNQTKNYRENRTTSSMARNQEKSQSMLNRWHSFKFGNDLDQERLNRRPPHASMTKSVKAAEHWRRTVIREFNEKLGMIQNASLGEHRLRDLNDDLNKLLREKYQWETRIVELNGPDYRTKGSLFDDDGNPISITGSATSKYMYFGAARELDGVSEMLKQTKKKKEKEEAEMKEKKKFAPPPQYYYYDVTSDQLSQEKKSQELNRQHLIDLINQAQEFKHESGKPDFEIINDYSNLIQEDTWKTQLLERKRQMLLERF